MANSTFNADYQLLARTLKKYRKASPYSQVQLAQRLGTSQKLISECERGVRRMDVVELIEITEAMGVEFMDFIAAFLKQRQPGLHPKLRRASPASED